MTPEEIVGYLPDEIKAEPKYLCTEQQRSNDPVELANIIKQFKPKDGWLVLQSHIVYFYDNNLIDLDEKDGIFTCTLDPKPEEELEGYFINAEMVNKDKKSLHIVEDGDGGWLITKYREENDKTPNTLMDKVSLLGKQRINPKNQPKINYRRYWVHSKDKGYHIKAARFMGYSNGDDLS